MVVVLLNVMHRNCIVFFLFGGCVWVSFSFIILFFFWFSFSDNNCHLQGFKAGMTHVVREVSKLNSKVHKKEVVEAVTIIEVRENVLICRLVCSHCSPRLLPWWLSESSLTARLPKV